MVDKQENCKGVATLHHVTFEIMQPKAVWLECNVCKQMYHNPDIMDNPTGWQYWRYGKGGQLRGHQMHLSGSDVKLYAVYHGYKGSSNHVPLQDPNIPYILRDTEDASAFTEEMRMIMSLNEDWELTLFDAEDVYDLMHLGLDDDQAMEIDALLTELSRLSSETPGVDPDEWYDLPLSETLETRLEEAMDAIFDNGDPSDDGDIDHYLDVFADYLDNRDK